MLDGGDNVGVSAAATDVAAHQLADLFRSFRLALRDQPGRRADLPRCAVPALEYEVRLFVLTGSFDDFDALHDAISAVLDEPGATRHTYFDEIDSAS